MRYVVNAKFIDGKPHLSIIDLSTGKVRLRWKLERIQKMFNSGEINKEEFLQPEKYGMNLLLKNLFLISCSQDLAQDDTREPHEQNKLHLLDKTAIPSGYWPGNVLMGPMK